MIEQKNILLAFYGDDVTGSTDALEFICRAGARALLFMEPPTSETLQAYPDLQAYGIAGYTRALPPRLMEQELMPAFQSIKASGAKHIHYKVCSTFDSSPQTGSIGRAIDCGAAVFNNQFVPVLGGMPALGRYCLFGNLFARMGIGSKGTIYRLDRHPSMSKHPVTPADESDLRVHLGKQTAKKIGLIDIITMQQHPSGWNKEIREGEDVILLDVLEEKHLLAIGAWLEAQCREEAPLFSVGSSGIEMALGLHWNAQGLLTPRHNWPALERAAPLLVISGSCSPITGAQLAYAKENGFRELVLDAEKICNGEEIEKRLIDLAVNYLQQQDDLVVHTGTKGGDNLPSALLGKVLGLLAKEIVERTRIKRVVVAGGDTSSYATRAMEIEALEISAPLVSGAPLCKAYSKRGSINGLEINLKGGQVGAKDYFLLLKQGRMSE
ncbi:MAG: four-carbon acid sugar kinase family protein [Williamsia sp.]|nr:four-carbon acid sugar kinase family protein [Williamsia sp.]